jgi:hypothetical protein
MQGAASKCLANLLGIILFNTIPRRTIPNPLFAHQNFLIENRVLRFAWRRSGENYPRDPVELEPPVLFVCLLVMLGALHCQARALQEPIREQERVW